MNWKALDESIDKILAFDPTKPDQKVKLKVAKKAKREALALRLNPGGAVNRIRNVPP